MSINTASLIKGITVSLAVKTESGKDSFNAPIYTTEWVNVENVLAEPTSTDDIISDTNLEGKREDLRLCIPKSDSHDWENTTVRFWGKTYKTYGYEMQWIEENVPLSWNRKIRIKRIG